MEEEEGEEELQGEERVVVCALMVGGGDSLVHTYALLILAMLNSCFGVTAVWRPRQRGRFLEGLCASMRGASCACVRKSEGAALETNIYKQEPISLRL